MSVTQSEGSTHAVLYRWQQTWAGDISYHAGKKGLNQQSLGTLKLDAAASALRDKWRRTPRSQEGLQTKAGIVQEMDPFQKPSKPSFHKAWQAYSIEPG